DFETGLEFRRVLFRSRRTIGHPRQRPTATEPRQGTVPRPWASSYDGTSALERVRRGRAALPQERRAPLRLVVLADGAGRPTQRRSEERRVGQESRSVW